MRIQERPRWGTEAANLLGEVYSTEGGLVLGRKNHLYMPTLISRLKMAPARVPQHRSHRSPQARDMISESGLVSLVRQYCPF
jgi:hypothetical protein